MSSPTNIPTVLTKQQIACLRGQLPGPEYVKAALSMWDLGYFCIDPLTPGPRGVELTPEGVVAARQLRL